MHVHVIDTGREFRFLLLSTSEPTTDDGYITNPTKSFCDRFVFNTAITRAQSLIVSVGNPFLLLEVEKLMIMRYGDKGKCWSNYLDYCLRHKTISFSDSQLSRTKQKKILSKVREIVKERLSRDFASEPITPAPAGRNVFSNADEFPPLPQAAVAPQAPPLATPTKDPPRAIPTYTQAAQAPPKPPPSTPPTARPPPLQQQALPQATSGYPPKRQPPQKPSTTTPQSPTPQWPAQRRIPQEIELRPQRVIASVGRQQLKQVPASAQLQQRQSPTSPKSVAQPVAQPGAQPSRPQGGHPRVLGQMPHQPPRSPMGQQPRSPIARQPRSPVAQQPRSPIAQQPRSPVGHHARPPSSVTQQPRSPVGHHARPPGNRQVHTYQPQFTQPHPQAANARLSRQSEAPSMLGGGGGGSSRKPADIKPSKLSLASHATWGNQQQPELAPGAIQSPAEFPPLEASATRAGKRQQQPGLPRQGKRKERQVPSNSIRDLSTRQTRRRSPVEEETSDESMTYYNSIIVLM